MSRSPFPLAGAAAADHAGSLACQRSPDLYFAEDPAALERAKTLCAGCPIRTACLRGSLERGEPWGVWGGEIVAAGQIVATKRGRGRPRKAAAA